LAFGNNIPVNQRHVGTKRHLKFDQVDQKYLIRGRCNDGKEFSNELVWYRMILGYTYMLRYEQQGLMVAYNA